MWLCMFAPLLIFFDLKVIFFPVVVVFVWRVCSCFAGPSAEMLEAVKIDTCKGKSRVGDTDAVSAAAEWRT